ncbi:MAG: hypothetical protein KatS3mg008_1549 [Acidimicrobiales bacterium]|nr:MAG: hypothetical protein KatS3mg008_1549 [Acidimicrobiales bacterium]
MDVVDWEVARAVAVRIAGQEPFSQSYHRQSLSDELPRIAVRAEELVAECTDLRTVDRARVRVVDRAEWIETNIRSFRRLLRPLLERMRERLASNPLAVLTGRATATELGLVLGWMSTRVLGQYDVMVPDEEVAGDEVLFVAPNILAMERAFAFPPSEFRMWVALHELTHRAQFVGVGWLRPHYLRLVDELVQRIEPDAEQFRDLLLRCVEALRSGRNPLADGGFVALALDERQRETLDRLTGMLAFLEGHGDVTMNRAAEGVVSSAPRFHRVLAERRKSASPLVKLVRRLTGLEAKLAQYELGEKFIAAVEAQGGPELLRKVWDGPEMLPTMREIRDPETWIRRVEHRAAPAAR